MSMITEKKVNVGKVIRVMREAYNSANEVVSDCESRKITDNDFRDVRDTDNWRWCGVESYEDAMNLMRHGYQPTVDKLKEQLKVSRMGDSKRISFENNIVGAVPVVPLAMMGVPNCMIDMKMKPIKCKVIDVYYDITSSAGTSSEDIIANGQKILGAIMELERKGYRFNLYAVQTYYSNGSADMLTVKVKSASQPLDLKRMSFPLTHTAFFRVIGFDWYSKTPKGTYRHAYGRALAYELKESQLKEFGKQMFGDNAVYLTGVMVKKKDEEYLKGVLGNDR